MDLLRGLDGSKRCLRIGEELIGIGKTVARNDDRRHPLSPMLIGDTDDSGLSHCWMFQQPHFDFGCVDIETTGDDHVLDTVANGQMPGCSEHTDVTGVLPPAPVSLRCRLRVPQILRRYELSTNANLAGFSMRKDVAVRILNRHPDNRAHLPAASQKFRITVLDGPFDVLGLLEGDVAGGFGLPEGLRDLPSEQLCALCETLGGDRGRADEQALQGCDVAGTTALFIDECIERGGWKEEAVDEVVLDRIENRRCVESVVEVDRLPIDDTQHAEKTCGVRGRSDHEVLGPWAARDDFRGCPPERIPYAHGTDWTTSLGLPVVPPVPTIITVRSGLP